ncbi:MAG TPA: ATP-binding protein [Bryobacteraceae bacterium]|nr:ATP-binding protein [Bryobacteraceae bacterium]
MSSGTAVASRSPDSVQDPRVKLLIVDDQEENLVALEAVLEGLGETIVKANSGREALRCLLDSDFAAILLDVRMPDMDGFECAALIRQRERSRDTPILFLTALGSEELQHRGYFMGAVDFLSKPIVPEILRSKVSVFVELARKNMQLQQKNWELEKLVMELRRAEEKVLRLNAELEQRVQERTTELIRTNEELRQFAYIASHDLQEPLRTVGSYAQLLAKRYGEKVGPDAEEFVKFIVEGVRRMHTLLNDMLSYSRVTEREARPMVATDVRQVVAVALANLEASIKESGAEITIGPLPTIEMDDLQIGQVFQNLISNAIKYKGPNPPKIHVDAHRDGDEWVFRVSDNGLGIDPRYHERIFGIFKRLHGKEIAGTGMGLAICKKIVERHGGRIWVESEPEKGSRFYFTLPA